MTTQDQPVATTERITQPTFDLLLSGTVFLDIIFTGLPALPPPGVETWATGMGSSPRGCGGEVGDAARR